MVNRFWPILTLSAALLLVSCQSNKSQPDAALAPGSAALTQLYQEGRASYLAGHYDKAATQFAQVFEVDPEHLNALVNWGAALSRGGKPDEGLPKLRQALARDPNNAAILYNLGVTYERLDQHADAIEHYDQAVARDQALLTQSLQRYLERQRPKLQDTEIDALKKPLPSSK